MQVWGGGVGIIWVLASKMGGGLAVSRAADSCNSPVEGMMFGSSSSGRVELKLPSKASRE